MRSWNWEMFVWQGDLPLGLHEDFEFLVVTHTSGDALE
jgi:hypothetical protein